MDIQRVVVSLEDKKFRFISRKSRKTIKNKTILHRIKSLKIPPNYQKVKISKSPKSKIQATGIDSKGRKQYIYHPEYIEEQQEQKFKELIDFGKSITRIRKDYKHHIEKKSSIEDKEKNISMILYLLDMCNFRIGTEEYKKKYNTFGATTINTNHILFKEGEVEVSFIGKKSVPNTSIIKQEPAINLLKKICHKHKGKEYLFYYLDEKTQKSCHINSSVIHNYLKKYHPKLKPKMFRTWNGNAILLKQLLGQKKPLEEKEIKKNLREAIKKVAQELHNTVSVAKKSYCNSEIYETYLNHNQLFFDFINENRKENGDQKSPDRILTLFLIKYYKHLD